MEDIVYKFFNSMFNHSTLDNIIKHNYPEFLKKNVGNKSLSWAKELIPLEKTLKDIL